MKRPKQMAQLPLEHWVGYRFSLVAARLGSIVRRMYEAEFDLTVPAWRSLAVIARYQPLTAKELGMRTSSDAFKVARSIELLVRRGLVHRDVDEDDRRRAKLRLTPAGRKIYKAIEKFVVRVESELTSVLDPSELASLRNSLDKLDQKLESDLKTLEWKSRPKG